MNLRLFVFLAVAVHAVCQCAEKPTQIRVDVKFISARNATLKQAGLDLAANGGIKFVAAEAAQDFLRQLRAGPKARFLSEPILLVLAGVKASVTTGTDMHVTDYYARSDGTYTPVSNSEFLGLGLEVTAGVDGNDIAIRGFAPYMNALLGVRRCTAKFDDQTEKFWEEPVVWTGSGSYDIRLKPGMCAVVPLTFSVRQATANARAFAKGGKVKESYTSRNNDVASEQVIVLLSAKVVHFEHAPTKD